VLCSSWEWKPATSRAAAPAHTSAPSQGSQPGPAPLVARGSTRRCLSAEPRCSLAHRPAPAAALQGTDINPPLWIPLRHAGMALLRSPRPVPETREAEELLRCSRSTKAPSLWQGSRNATNARAEALTACPWHLCVWSSAPADQAQAALARPFLGARRQGTGVPHTEAVPCRRAMRLLFSRAGRR